jgi:hypothetical protein
MVGLMRQVDLQQLIYLEGWQFYFHFDLHFLKYAQEQESIHYK